MLEFALINYITNENHIKIFNLFYSTMEKYIRNKNTKNPDMTDHEIRHIANVMENANILVEKKYFPLQEEDFFYLCLSICIHDLAMGNIYNTRIDHNKKIYEVFDEILELNDSLHTDLQDEEKDIICKIVEAHSGDADEAYKKIQNEERYQHIHILYISMILRVADELDITQKRIKGVTLSTLLPNMQKESQLHWVKHETIVSWEILQDDRSCITLYLKSDILEKYIPHYKLDINKDEYINHMYNALYKLKNELEIIFERCSRIGGLTWNLRKINLKSHDKNVLSSFDYISELNQLISDNNENSEKKTAISKIDKNIRINQEQKNESDQIFDKNTIDNSGKYFIIGGEEYREKLNKYIGKNTMLRQDGCYKHRDLRILSWLDSFGFHQNNALLLESSNIIAQDIRERINNVDYIIGLGLKGAKIASVVGLRLEKPVLFFINNDIRIDDLNINIKFTFVMITDCIITGETALSCKNRLLEKNPNNEIESVYSVFLRKHKNDYIDDNDLIEIGIPIFTINDTYTYNLCPYKEQNDCPLYRTYGEKQYERSYRRSKSHPSDSLPNFIA